MKTRYIGDIHGNFNAYKAIIKDIEFPSVQVGDFGLGFDVGYDAEMLSWQQANPAHRFIRGNHDDPAVCRNSTSFIKDGLIENDMMYIGGAWSIDRDYRTEGIDYWSDEELSFQELSTLIDIYELQKPEVMITHDAPSSVVEECVLRPRGWSVISTRTGVAFDTMFQLWKPEVWIFGHHHQDIDVIIDGTRFICLDGMSHIDLDPENPDFDTKIVSRWKRFG